MVIDIGFDSETELITSTCIAPRLVCLTWADDENQGIRHWSEADGLFGEWLSRPEIRLIGHNVAYDMGVMMAQFPDFTAAIFEAYAAGRVHDTMLCQKLVDIGRGEFRGKREPDGTWTRHDYHLLDLVWRNLGIRISKGEDTWRLRYSELRDMPCEEWPTDALHYAVNDARVTRDVWGRFQAEEFAPYMIDSSAQARAAFWMQLMSCWGIKIDKAKINLLGEQIAAEYHEHEDLLREYGIIRKDGTRDTKMAKARMIEAMGDRPVKQTAKGGVSLDEEACTDAGDPVLESYAKLSSLKTVLTKDVPAMSVGYIHARFDSLVASGRTSCRGYNLQNPPRKGGVRECFVPRPGNVFAFIDLDGAELRGMAQACLMIVGSSKLAEALNAGKDPHLILGAQLSGRSYDEIKAAYANGEQWAVDSRQSAKIGNFGFAGGMGVEKFCLFAKTAYGTILSIEDGTALREAWLAAWPEFREYFRLVGEQIRNDPDELVDIVQLFSNRPRGRLRFSEACNTFFQGLIADATKAAGFEIARACYDPESTGVLFGSRIVNYVHDEFILEVPEDIAHECAQELAEIVRRVATLYLPDVPPTGTPYLSRYWSKDAFAMYDARGRLIPWNGEKKEKKAKAA